MNTWRVHVFPFCYLSQQRVLSFFQRQFKPTELREQHCWSFTVITVSFTWNVTGASVLCPTYCCLSRNRLVILCGSPENFQLDSHRSVCFTFSLYFTDALRGQQRCRTSFLEAAAQRSKNNFTPLNWRKSRCRKFDDWNRETNDTNRLKSCL